MRYQFFSQAFYCHYADVINCRLRLVEVIENDVEKVTREKMIVIFFSCMKGNHEQQSNKS